MSIISGIKYYFLLIFFWPAKILYHISSINIRRLVDSDIDEMNKRMKLSKTRGLLYWLIFHQPYRNLFYYRIGKLSKIISWYLRPYPLFFINILEGMVIL